jgi:serine/threonine-protein kinase
VTTELATLLQDSLGSDYRLDHELDGGGMSRLFVATDTRHNRRVVIKVLPPELLTADSAARFEREIEVTVRLQHPHILPILTSGSWGDGLFYITPYIPGESLRTRLMRDGRLSIDEILSILDDVSGAIAFAHSRRVIHRDIKPGNILLADGHAILADFGIARAVVTAATPITITGLQLGTPDYMPPDESGTEAGDLYALGIVAYEMLVGKLPKRGASPTQIIAARGKVPGDSRVRLQALAQFIAKAFALDPFARFSSAAEFREGLVKARSARRAIDWRVLAATAGMVVAGIGVAFAVTRHESVSLDPDRFVVSPAASDSLSARIGARIAESIEEWRGTTVSRSSVLADVKDASSSTDRIRAALRRAHAEGAQNVVLVDARRDGDSVIARVALYDVRSENQTRLQRIALPADGDPAFVAMATRAATSALVRERTELPWRAASDRAAPSLAAWRIYDAGRMAIDQWKLTEAERLFRQSLAIDPQLAAAHLWLAQTVAWNTRTVNTEARGSLRRALDLHAQLSPVDSARAAGLLALSERRHAAACAAFGTVVRSDSSDLSGWLGLGDCQAQNRGVMRDPRSPTGWYFESSYEAAARAYTRASEVGAIAVGSDFRGWVLGRLAGVLFAVPNRLRLGSLAEGDTVSFAALPYLDHDTLAFAPYELRAVASGKHDPAPRAIQDAVQRNREILRHSAEEWVRRAPLSAAAYDSLAGWMEMAGGAVTMDGREISTRDAIRQARKLSTDPVQRLRLAVADVRLLIKEAKFADARAEADSLLRAGAAKRAAEVPGVAGLAALLGHVEETARARELAARSEIPVGSGVVTLPPQLSTAAARLMSYAAFAPSGDSVTVIARRTVGFVDSYFPDRTVAARVRGAVVGGALSLAYPQGASMLADMTIENDETSRAYALIVRGDTAGAKNLLAAVRRMNEGRSVGTAIDRNLRRARLALILGDTAYAIHELDPALRALPTLGPSLMEEVPQVIALVRSLVLRAELAERARDRATAAQCARAVIVLWSAADPELNAVVASMRRLTN